MIHLDVYQDRETLTGFMFILPAGRTGRSLYSNRHLSGVPSLHSELATKPLVLVRALLT